MAPTRVDEHLSPPAFLRLAGHALGNPLERVVEHGGEEDPKEGHADHAGKDAGPQGLAHFRAGGPGWQSRVNAALRKAAKLDPPARRKRG